MADEKTKEELEQEEKKAAEADARKKGDGTETAEPDDMLKGIKAAVADAIADALKPVHERMDAVCARMDAADARIDGTLHMIHRDDAEDPEKEKEQAATLEKLAAEEEKEAEEMEKQADAARGDSRLHWAAKRSDEAEEDHSERVDRLARDCKADRFTRKDGEECKEHSERADAMARRHDVHRSDATFRPKKRDDARRDDSEEDEEKKKEEEARKADSARRDDEMRKLAARVADQDRQLASLRSGPSDQDRRALAEIQERADGVLMMLNDKAPPPMHGEAPPAYRIRLARRLQAHSPKWKDEDLSVLARTSASAYDNVEGMIYADAAQAAREPRDLAEGSLVRVPVPSSTGHRITEYRGDPLAWLGRFMHTGACATRFGAR